MKKYSVFDGYGTYQSSADLQSNRFPKICLFVEWHQCLGRSATEGSWNNKFPSDSVQFLKSVKRSAKEVFGHEDAVHTVLDCSGTSWRIFLEHLDRLTWMKWRHALRRTRCGLSCFPQKASPKSCYHQALRQRVLALESEMRTLRSAVTQFLTCPRTT